MSVSSPRVFLHVMKTAGNTLYGLLRDIHEPRELLKLHMSAESLATWRTLRVRRDDPGHAAAAWLPIEEWLARVAKILDSEVAPPGAEAWSRSRRLA